MKLLRNLFASGSAQHLVFACGCVVALSGGIGTKLVLNHIDAINDQFESDMKLPSQVYLHSVILHNKHVTAGQPAGEPAKAAPPQEAAKQPVLP